MKARDRFTLDNGYPKRKSNPGRKHQHRPSQKVLQKRREGAKKRQKIEFAKRRKLSLQIHLYYTFQIPLHPRVKP